MINKVKFFKALDEQMVETIDLGEFHERFQGETMRIWLNPGEVEMKRLSAIPDITERGKERLTVQILDLTREETLTLFSKDAPFCEWLIDRIMALNQTYGEGRAKKSATG